MPSLLAHRGVSLHALANHQWITTEGVFGIALGVSTSFVFLFVLFGALAGMFALIIKLAPWLLVVLVVCWLLSNRRKQSNTYR